VTWKVNQRGGLRVKTIGALIGTGVRGPTPSSNIKLKSRKKDVFKNL
jgi:hypothetical protein